MPEKHVNQPRPELDEAIALHNSGDYQRAAQIYTDLLKKAPQDPDLLHLYGLLLYQTGAAENGRNYLQQALDITPENPLYLSNMGTVLIALEEYEKAQLCYEQAIKRNPMSVDAYNGLGVIHRHCNRYPDAISCYKQATTLNPDFAEGWSNLASVLTLSGKPLEGLDAAKKALSIDTNLADAWNNSGFALTVLGHFAEAKPQFEQAITLRSNFAMAHFNLASNYLRAGQYQQGWWEYEWRIHLRKSHPPPTAFNPAYWDGRDIAGKRLLLLAEQGMGDFLQFIRFARQLKEMNIYVIAECDKRLISLMSHVDFIDELSIRGETPPEYDTALPIMSLGRVLNITNNSLYAEKPYLQSQQHLDDYWSKQLNKLCGYKVGITWCGNPDNPINHLRSFSVKHFLALATDNIDLISLQTGDAVTELQANNTNKQVIDLGLFEKQLNNKIDFIDTTAILNNLALYITSCTVTAHLAGALGIKTWLVLSYVADWRWGLNSQHTPWYPSLRIFRQPKPGDWDGVFKQIKTALAEECEQNLSATTNLISRTDTTSIISTPNGHLSYEHNDPIACRHAEIFSPGEEPDPQLLNPLLPDEPVIVEAGAYIGKTTLSLTRLITGKGMIYSFEPDYKTFLFLNANIALNNHTQVYSYQASPFLLDLSQNSELPETTVTMEYLHYPIEKCDLLVINKLMQEHIKPEYLDKFIAAFSPKVYLTALFIEEREELMNLLYKHGYSKHAADDNLLLPH